MKAKSRILIFLFSFLLANGVYGYDVENIVPKDFNNIEFAVTPEASFLDGEVTGEIKVLKDLEITVSTKDFDDNTKIVLNLKNSLLPNKSYNLLSVFGVDGNMDFTLGEELELVDLANGENVVGIQGISRLIVVDSKTIEVYFNEAIEETEFEFKLFRESNTDYINNEAGQLSLTLSDSLDKSSGYLLMLISLKDSSGVDLEFDEEIYDFFTNESLGDVTETPVEDNTEEMLIPEENMSEEVTEEEVTEELNSAAEETSEDSMSGELNDVALNAAVTPKSGPETGVLILLTALSSLFIFIRKRFQK